MTRNKLYVFLSAACLAGSVWVAFAYRHTAIEKSDFIVCLFKRVTTLPCPSCGSTRSLLAILKGDLFGAFMLNPMGFLLFAILLVTPIWILFDVITKKSTLLVFFRKGEHFLSRKWVAYSAVVIVILNWIWNIFKGI